MGALTCINSLKDQRKHAASGYNRNNYNYAWYSTWSISSVDECFNMRERVVANGSYLWSRHVHYIVIEWLFMFLSGSS